MAIRARSFTVSWKAAADESSYNGFNVVITLAHLNPNESYVDKKYVKPPYSAAGNYQTEYSSFLIDDTKVYEIWVQLVSYGKDSMWRSLSGLEIPDDGIGTITGASFSEVTQEELDAGLADKTIDGSSTSLTNLNGANIVNGSIVADKIQANSITAIHIQSNTIEAIHLKANIIEAQHIKTGVIDATKISAGAITAEKIDAGAVTADKIEAGAISSSKISAGSINASHIESYAIEGFNIKSGTIVSDHIASKTINSGHIATGSIESTNIKAGAILTDHIASHTIEGYHIKSETIESSSLVSGTIKANKIDTADLFSINANITGALTVTGGGQIDLGNGNILASGSITATSGRIGNWIISGNTLQSNTDVANRIVLDQTASRISIVSDTSDTKVAMGYLGGLPRNDDPLTNYTSSDYGFWAAPGDKLHIDGDAEYTSGDWIISHDSSYLVKDSSGNTIVKMGSDAGAHGVHVYNSSGIKLAEYSGSKILIGRETNGVLTAGLRYTLADGLELVGKMTVSASDVTGLGTLATKNSVSASDVSGLGSLATKSSVTNSDVTSIDGGKITTGTISANRIAAGSIAASKLSSAETFVGLSIQSNGYVAGRSGWQIKENGEFYFYGPSGKSFTFNGSTFQFTGTIVAASNVSGLGSLATQSSVSTSQVSGLGSLATKSSVSDSYITSISGSKITTGNISLNSSVAMYVYNGGKISLYSSSNTHMADLVPASSSFVVQGSYYGTPIFNIRSFYRILIGIANQIDIASTGVVSIDTGGAAIYVRSTKTIDLNANNINANGYRIPFVNGTVGYVRTHQMTNIAYLSWDGTRIGVVIDSTYYEIKYISDSRLKDSIVPYSFSLDQVEKLNPVRFRFKGQSKENIGLLAQDVIKVIPEVIFESKDGYLGVDYQNISVCLIGAIKELKARIEALENR